MLTSVFVKYRIEQYQTPTFQMLRIAAVAQTCYCIQAQCCRASLRLRLAMVRVGVEEHVEASSGASISATSSLTPPTYLQQPSVKRLSRPRGTWRNQIVTLATSTANQMLVPPQQTESSKRTIVPPNVVRVMPLLPRLRYYLTRPEESKIGWVVHHCVLVALVANTCVLTIETLDGPRHASGTDPAYPFLPDGNAFRAAECSFSVLYVVEFLARWATASSQPSFWRSKHTWLALLALLPVFIVAATRSVENTGVHTTAEVVAFNLRLARIMRILVLSRVHVGSKVLFGAVSKSVAPLSITVRAAVRGTATRCRHSLDIAAN